MDLLSLIGRDTPLKKIASTGGGEWAGPCPFCGGHDRFRVQPERGRWWCRQCSPDPRWEDAIAYLQRREGLSYPQARQALGAQPPSAPMPAAQHRSQRIFPPEAGWRRAATFAVQRGVELLWSDAGQSARRWLNDRGLQDETLHQWRVGFCRGEHTSGLWVPYGILLPWHVEGAVWQLKVRRPRIAGTVGPKYVSVRGGRPHLYGADMRRGHRQLILTEGEFDAMLLWQEARDLVDVATLGSCAARPHEDVLWYLVSYRTIFLAHDQDAAGEDGAQRLRSLSNRLRRIHPLGQGDINDFHSSGGSLRDWVRYHLTRAQLQVCSHVIVSSC